MTLSRAQTDIRLAIMALTLGLGMGIALAFLALLSSPQNSHAAFSASEPVSPRQGPTETITLTRGPYLQSVTTGSIVVVWDTQQPATGQVDYGPTVAYSLGVSSTLPITHHAITLTGLGPYTVYHYQVSGDGQVLWGDNTFRTAAPPTQTTFSFVAFGDTRTGHAAHQSVVSRIVTLAPDFVLHTGDFVKDGNNAAEWTTFFTIEQDLLRQSPLFGVTGNHEMNASHYFDAFHLPNNEHWYSFDYGNAHFIALQVDDIIDYADYKLGSAQYTWLENDLAAADERAGERWKTVFFHIPPYSTGGQESDKSVRYALGPLFAQYGVDLVFNGHSHNYERSISGDVTYIVTGGGGAPLYRQVGDGPYPYSQYFSSTHHCVSISIDGGTLTGVGVRPDGTEFDRFTLHKIVIGDYSAHLPLVQRGPCGGGSTLIPPPPQPQSVAAISQSREWNSRLRNYLTSDTREMK